MKLTTISGIFTFLLFFLFAIILIFGFSSLSFNDINILFNNDNFNKAIIFTLKTSLFATLLSIITGIPAGFYLARKKNTISKIFDILFDIPIVIPPLIVGVLLLNFFNIEFIQNIYSFIFTTIGASIAQFFIAFPFTMKASKNAFEMVSPVYERIAMTLGASRLKSFYDTTFKIAFPGILSGIILTWLRCIGEFGATLMIGGGIAGKTENLPVFIYVNMMSGDFNLGLAASFISIIIAFILVIIVKVFYYKSKKY
jgi:molybdate transport system permease protein